MSVLPIELHREILIWLRQKPLFRCRRVCKAWRDVLVNKCVIDLDITDYGYRHDLSLPLHTTFVNMKTLFIDHRACYNITGDKDVRYLTALTTLNLFNTRHSFSDEAITLLTNLTKLNCGRYSNITDRGIRELTKLRSLKCGYSCRISGDGISSLTNLEKFECMRGIPITRHSVKCLTKLRNLSCQFNTTISEGPLLRFLTNLEKLNLADNNAVRDEDIISLPNLTSLNLSSNDTITDECLRCLTNLRALNIDNARLISDAGIRDLTSLTTLKIGSGKVISDEGIRCLTNLTRLEFAPHYTLISETGLSRLPKLERAAFYQERIKEYTIERELAIQYKRTGNYVYIGLIFVSLIILLLMPTRK